VVSSCAATIVPGDHELTETLLGGDEEARHHPRDRRGHRLRLAIERADEVGELGVTAHATEAAARFVEAGRDPAHEHAPVAPAADVADEATDEAVQVLDRVGAAERAVERARDAEPLQGQRLVEAFLLRSRRTLGERPG
jgi:hypothetical protein